MVPPVLDRIFAAVLLAVHGAPAPDTSVLARPAPPALSYAAEVSSGPFSPALTAQSYISVNLENGEMFLHTNVLGGDRRPIVPKQPVAQRERI